MQIYENKLFITDYRAIFFDRHYAPSRVMPLLDLLKHHPNLPAVDVVVAAVDEPRIKTLVHPQRVDSSWLGGLTPAVSLALLVVCPPA